MNTHLELVEQDNLRMYAAIKRVREIHNPLHDKWLSDLRWCAICEVEYPCGTIKALDGEQ